LLNRVTKGILKCTYDLGITTKTRYPMSNYICNQNLSNTNIIFISQLSIVSIYNSVHEALADSRWKDTMNKKMDPCKRRKHGNC